VLLVIAFLAFVSLGIPDAVLGVAWPSMRRAFDLSIDRLGWLLAAAMAGYLVSSFTSGAVVQRLGIGRVLLWSNVLTVGSALGFALAPAWTVVLGASVLTGLGAGGIDAAINGYAAVRFSPRVVSWLHASWGVGAALGPIVMTAALTRGLGWRGGYGVIAVILVAMTMGFALTHRLWDASGSLDSRSAAPAVVRAPDGPGPRSEILQTLVRPAVLMNVALFFVYTGLEATAGQWTYSLFTEARGMSPATAGTLASAFWASLMAGRVLGGALTTRLPAVTILKACLLMVPIGGTMLWASQGAIASLGSLVVLGVGLAPVYPLLMSETPRRVGTGPARHAVGFQVAAAYLGAAVLPGAAGALAQRFGLETIGPFLLGAGLLLLVLHELALKMTPRPAPSSLFAPGRVPTDASD
jgi:fucose permease